MFNNGGGLRSSVSFWDLIRELHPKFRGDDFRKIFEHYAEKTGVDVSKKKSVPPTASNVEFYQKEITDEVRSYLHDHRGLNDDSIKKYQVGWSSKRERLTYPVFDSNGQLVNIRFHAWKKGVKPKTQNWGGYGQKRLWGVDRLDKRAGRRHGGH